MASKSIFLLLLIANVAVQIYAEATCPHTTFWEKHVCEHCTTDESYEAFAKTVMANVRDKRVATQTIYRIAHNNKKQQDWEPFDKNGEPHCRAKSEAGYSKLDCKKERYECIESHSKGNGEHLMMTTEKKCPDPAFKDTKICWTCKNAKDVETYAKHAATNRAYSGKPPSSVTIMILNNQGESMPSYWEAKGNKCKLTKKNKRTRFDCNRTAWVCDTKKIKKGRAVHNLKRNGHLVEK